MEKVQWSHRFKTAYDHFLLPINTQTYLVRVAKTIRIQFLPCFGTGVKTTIPGDYSFNGRLDFQGFVLHKLDTFSFTKARRRSRRFWKNRLNVWSQGARVDGRCRAVGGWLFMMFFPCENGDGCELLGGTMTLCLISCMTCMNGSNVLVVLVSTYILLDWESVVMGDGWLCARLLLQKMLLSRTQPTFGDCFSQPFGTLGKI